jgi:transposase-like protein
MEDKKCRSYPEESKLEALEMFRNGGKSAGQIERELGITPGLLGKWRARYQIIRNRSREAKIVPGYLEEANAETRRLQRGLTAIDEEREILI